MYFQLFFLCEIQLDLLLKFIILEVKWTFYRFTAWTDDDIIAQGVLFFVAGFETASSGICFLLYELAVNPDIQDRLAKEIKEQDAKNGGKFDFNSIQNLKYLDMVVSGKMVFWCFFMV